MSDPTIVETEHLRALRARRQEEGPIFRVGEKFCAVLDADAVQRIEAANYADLTMHDGFVDTVRGRSSEDFSWARLRSAWSKQMRHLTATASLRDLARRMADLLDAEVGRPQDLVWLAERAVVDPLIPMIVGGLAPRAHRRVVREVHSKVSWVLSDVDTHRAPRGHRARMIGVASPTRSSAAVRRCPSKRAPRGYRSPRSRAPTICRCSRTCSQRACVSRASHRKTSCASARNSRPSCAMGATTIEVDASHLSLISHPQEIAGLIIRATAV